MLDDILKGIVALAGLVGILFWGGLFLFHNWEFVLKLLISCIVFIVVYVIYKMPNE